MSAFMCSKRHIRVLAVWGTGDGWSEPGLADMGRTARDLHEANCKSLDARYEARAENMKGEAFGGRITHKDVSEAQEMDPVAVIKLAQCFAYQACEYDGWETSTARKTVQKVKDRACRALPGYDDAPWGIS
jgi:hypothetical protein